MTTIRGVPSEVRLTKDDGMKTHCVVNLHNVVAVTQNRPGERVARLSSLRMAETCVALRFSLGCD
jgi:mRNA-degrading endonuclease toxin of MazEF toxin-antitoxin module